MDTLNIHNAALERMRAGELALGLVMRMARSPEIALIAKTSGHDFLFIDTQHALYSLETIGAISIAAAGYGVAPIVRVPRYDDIDIPKVLDAGALGIIVADIANAEQARRVVETCRFPPRGRRSVQSTFPSTAYRPWPAAEVLREVERTTLVGCMIETAEGARNLEEIAAVEGVDLIHIGCTDLMADWGKVNDFGDKQLVDFVFRTIEVCKKNGKFCGLGGDRDDARLKAYFDAGLNLYTTQTDITYLLQGATQRVKALRGK